MQGTVHPRTEQLRLASLGAALALALLCVMWELWWAPTGRGTLALKALPLALCLPGLRRHRMATYRGLCLLVWFYFIEGVVRAWGDSGVSRIAACTEVLLSLLVFAVATSYIRWRLAQGRLLAASAAAADATQPPA